MSASTSLSMNPALAADSRSLDTLKAQVGQGQTPETIRETAKQFESVFMRELIKSMRQATMKSGMLDNAGSDLGTDLFDQQMAVQMSGKPGGLSDMIAAQLAKQMGVDLPASGKAGAPLSPDQLSGPSLSGSRKAASVAAAAYNANGPKPTESQSQFVERHTQAAVRIEKETGIPASYMVGQAGHESGWGQHEIRMRGGKSAHNLFGIKADASWTGKVAEVTTTEYVNGVANKKVARFRAYDSYDESFRDYARMITQSPRYAQVTQQTHSAVAFASSLQKAGYATDPNYAAKLSRAIETTQRLQSRMQVVAQTL
jgi:flagellar protein FlgJ